MEPKKINHYLKQSIFLSTIDHKTNLKFLSKTIKKGSKKVQVPLLLRRERSLALTLKKVQKSLKEKLITSTFKKKVLPTTSEFLNTLHSDEPRSFSYKNSYSSNLFYSKQIKMVFSQDAKISFFKEQQNIAHTRTNIKFVWWDKRSKSDNN